MITEKDDREIKGCERRHNERSLDRRVGFDRQFAREMVGTEEKVKEENRKKRREVERKKTENQ